MNYLQLVNRARQEGGVSGAALISLGGTVSQESQRFKDWVNEAWREVQIHCADWDFMRSDFTFDTTVAVQTYAAASLSTPLASFRNWKRDSLRAYLTATGFGDEQILPFLDWETFRNLYLYGNQRSTTGRPTLFSIKPDKSIVIGPVPDATYTVVGEYFRQASDLTADTDIPGITDEYHMLIVWRALRSYGLYEAASEVVVRADGEIRRLMSKIENDLMPEITSGPSLA
jgi:hypothetical protein